MGAPGWRPLALLLGTSGTLHLVRPEIFEPLIPRQLGQARPWVTVSGIAELACAAGLSLPSTRRRAGLLSAALLVAVFPGNVQHAISAHRSSRTSTAYKTATLARLPVQLPLISWALRIARDIDEP